MTNQSALVPCLRYPDAAAAMAWLRNAFGFEMRSQHMADGLMTYAEAERDGVVVALEGSGPGEPAAAPLRLMVTVDDAEPLYHQARSAGATMVAPLAERAGRREFTAADLGGYLWTFTGSGQPAVSDRAAAEHLDSLTDLLTPFAVRAAASARVAELIAAGTRELGALAAASGTDQDVLGRLLRYLVHRGVFTEPAPGQFALTDTGRLLADPDPAGPRAWLDMAGGGTRSDLTYAGLLHSLQSGEPAYAAVHGCTFWEDLDAEPSYQEFFDEVMTAGHRGLGPQVAALYDWTAVRLLVDVGGGSGALLGELLRAHPKLRAILVDRPDPARITARRLAATELASRVEVVAGDFFSRLPAGGDVYMVSRAISDWDDPDAVTILRTCREAAAPRGRILIVEVLPTDPFVPHQAVFDLQMLATVGGRERSPAEFTALAQNAGLTVTQILRGREGLMLIECAATPDHALPSMDLPGPAVLWAGTARDPEVVYRC